VFAIVLLCAALGAAAGVVWQHLWTPSTGLVWNHQWQQGLLWVHPKTMAEGFTENAYQDSFSAAGIYVLITAAAGAIAGLIAAIALAASELVTLVALIVGGAAGGVIAKVVGYHRSAADPAVLAKHLPNGTSLPDRIQLPSLHLLGIHLTGLGLFAVFPGAALLVMTVVFLAYEPRSRRAPSDLSILTGRSEPSPLP